MQRYSDYYTNDLICNCKENFFTKQTRTWHRPTHAHTNAHTYTRKHTNPMKPIINLITFLLTQAAKPGNVSNISGSNFNWINFRRHCKVPLMVSWKALQRLFSAAKDSATRDCPMMLFLEDMTAIKQINTLKRKKKEESGINASEGHVLCSIRFRRN